MYKLEKYEPKKVFEYFEEITKIPRCSFEEEKIADYLENFAKERNLNYIRDINNNIIIKKNGTEGYENSPSVIIQGHIDMVCEKNENSKHDFSTDPIEFIIKDGMIISEETTLGADNGIAVAMALSILDSKDLKHPPLEVLFTSNEESGMTGARNLDTSPLESKMLINLDSEEEGVCCVGCASGKRESFVFNKEYKDIKGLECYDLVISGLKGGHSGQEIDKGLGNAIKLLSRALNYFNNKFELELIDITAGSKVNAIPRYAKAVIAVKSEDIKEIQRGIINLNKDFMNELSKIDPDLRLNFEKSNINFDKAFKTNLKNDIINLLMLLPSGVLSMSHNVAGLVSCSMNVGVIESDESKITVLSSVRAEIETLRDNVSESNKIVAKLSNAQYNELSAYPGWQFRDKSYLREVASTSYKKQTGKELKFEVIHAGLECGILRESLGDIDMISLGPNMYGVHAPGERLEIKSTENVYNLVLEILENLK